MSLAPDVLRLKRWRHELRRREIRSGMMRSGGRRERCTDDGTEVRVEPPTIVTAVPLSIWQRLKRVVGW